MNEAESLYVHLAKAASHLDQKAALFLKPFGISATQYNVLRILRGAEPEGATCSQVGERMLKHDPDITRMLDRLEKRGLITRHRSAEDRRVVVTRITENGLRLLSEIDEPLAHFWNLTLEGLQPGELRMLIEGLEKLRRLVA